MARGIFKDLTGMQFGKLTVVRRDDHGHKRPYWECRCECGNTIFVSSTHLLAGDKTSCGCDKVYKHGDARGPRWARLYRIYKGIKTRCVYKGAADSKNYGGRGITMCSDWVNDYNAFKKWALENGYDDSLSIDRIDVDGNYCPENCRWATWEQQNNNRRYHVWIEANGKKQTAAQWARELNMNYQTIVGRAHRGLSPEEILQPV